MNIKDRINSKKKINPYVKLKNDDYISEIFIHSEQSENIIKSSFNNNRNFLITFASDCDESIIRTYIKNVTNSNKLRLNLIGIEGLLRQYEQIITGSLTENISLLHLGSFDNILEKIRILISLNYPNLSNNQICEVIKTVNPVLIYFSKDEDGLFFVQNIVEFEFKDTDFIIKNLYPETKTSEIATEKTNDLVQDSVEIQPSPIIDNEIKDEEILASDVVSQGEIELQNSNISEKKVNKYKLLREKIKNKK